MTAEGKTAIARFLDLAGDYLKDGYVRNRDSYAFEDDAAPPPIAEPNLPEESTPGSLSSLPLAYQVDEYEDEAGSLQDIDAAIVNCKACGLGAAGTRAVPGEGVDKPLVMVIGGCAEEDSSGCPFAGPAGQLLDKMLASIALFRDKNCYITSIVKCRPPGNRDPEPGEIAACLPFLEQQITLLRPRVILCTGLVAAQSLLKTGQGLNALRGIPSEFTPGDGEAIPVICTFHPGDILLDESLKRPAWEDLKLLKSHLAF